MSDDFQSEIAFLGIEASPSFVRQPEGIGAPNLFYAALWLAYAYPCQRFASGLATRHA